MTAYEQRMNEGHTPVQQLSKTATTSATSYTQQAGGKNQEITALELVNRSASKEILVSTDGGTNWFAVLSISTYHRLLNSCFELQVKVASGTASYDLFFTVKP